MVIQMIRKIIVFLIIILLTGCWNYRELNDLAIVGSLSIEVIGEEYQIGVQVMNTQKQGTSSGSAEVSSSSPAVVFKFKGKTIHEALRKMTTESPRKLYFGHITMIMISEKAAKEGFKDISDFLIRDHETRKQFTVMIIRNEEVDKVLTLLSHLEALPSQENLDVLKAATNFYGNVTPISFDEFLSFGYAEGVEPVLPYADLVGDVEEGKKKESTEQTVPVSFLRFKGISVFNSDKLVGYLDERDSIGYNLIVGNIKSTVIPFKCDESNYASIEIISYKSNLTVEVKNNKPFVKINVTGEAHQSEINCDIEMENLEDRNKIKKLANEEIKKIISSSIDTVKQDYGSDIFGFGRHLYRYNYKYWSKNKKNWNDIFQNIDYEIKSNLILAKKGSALESTKGEERGEEE